MKTEENVDRRESWNRWPLLALQADEFVPVLRNKVPQVDYYEERKRVGTVNPNWTYSIADGYHGNCDELFIKGNALIAADAKCEASVHPLAVRLSERFGFIDKNGKLFSLEDVHRYGTMLVAPDGTVVGAIRKDVSENGTSSLIVCSTKAINTACVEPWNLMRQAELFSNWAAFGAEESALPKFKEQSLVDVTGFPGWLLCVDAIRNEFCVMHRGRLICSVSPRLKLTYGPREATPAGLLKAAADTIKWRYFGAVE